jgi:hypothetical protein
VEAAPGVRAGASSSALLLLFVALLLGIGNALPRGARATLRLEGGPAPRIRGQLEGRDARDADLDAAAVLARSLGAELHAESELLLQLPFA